MPILKKFLILIDSKMERPTSYGWFHLMFIIIIIISSVFIIKKYKNNEIKGKIIILFLSILCLILEVYKQINFSFNYSATNSWWDYQWYAFPFQFCSTPMYVGLIASLIKNKKIKNSLYYFLATYGLLGGLITFIYPETCFVNTIGINIQTMIHHGSMILMGITTINCLNLKFNFKSFLKATKIFLFLVLTAISIDIITYYFQIDNGLEMFYISPFHNSTLPILSFIDSIAPYYLFLSIYILAFSFACLLITYVVKWIKK